MTARHLRRDRDDRGVVTLTLDHEERRNALGPDLMAALRGRLEQLADDGDVRVLVLTGAGSAFSAGADLDWMRSQADSTHDEAVADSRRLEDLFRTLDTFPRPVVARVNGHALGGAMGLIASADVAVAVDDAKLGFTEARLGLAPAVIATYVLPKIGPSAARRFFLTGEVFDATTARDLGLVHEVCPREELGVATEGVVGRLLAGGPGAQAAIKRMVRDMSAADDAGERADLAVSLIARLRTSREGQEGMAAFFEDRPPEWRPS